MNDSDAPEKEITLEGVDTQTDAVKSAPSVDQQLNAMSRESKVYLGGHTTQEQFVPSKLNVQRSNILYKVLAALAVLLLLASIAGFVWALSEKAALADDLVDTKSQLAEAEAVAERSSLTAEQTGKATEATPEPVLTTKEKIGLTASRYYCAIKDFGCDKVQAEVTKYAAVSSDASPTAPNRTALVKAVAGPGVGGTLYLWLVDADDTDSWAVVYEGANNPPASVIEKFGISKDYLL